MRGFQVSSLSGHLANTLRHQRTLFSFVVSTHNGSLPELHCFGVYAAGAALKSYSLRVWKPFTQNYRRSRFVRTVNALREKMLRVIA